MPNHVRLWRADAGDRLVELPRGRLDLESRLEAWLDRDISVLNPDLLVIGRQVQTEHGGFIDLLCLEPSGDVVVVELKRDKTPREVVAQLLDYASWVQDLSHERISSIANAYLVRQGQDLTSAFKTRFGTDLPDVLNENHSLLLVGSFIDASSERIIGYLSDIHGVRLNAATFDYFNGNEAGEFVARSFLLEPEIVEQRSTQRGGSKRRTSPSLEEFEQIAADRGVGEIFDVLIGGLREYLHPQPMKTLVALYGKLEGTSRVITSLLPPVSSKESGLAFQVYMSRLERFTGEPTADILARLPVEHEPWKYTATADEEWSGFAGFFRTVDEAQRFILLFEGRSRD